MSPKSNGVGHQAGDSRQTCNSSPKAISLLAEFLLALGTSVFVLLCPSTNWMRPTLIVEGNRLYPKATDFSIHLIQRTPVQKHPECI